MSMPLEFSSVFGVSGSYRCYRSGSVESWNSQRSVKGPGSRFILYRGPRRYAFTDQLIEENRSLRRRIGKLELQLISAVSSEVHDGLVASKLHDGRDKDLIASFEELAGRWSADCLFESSSDKLFSHPAYQRIIGLGPKVVPLIVRRLQGEPDHWFWALRAITGENPASGHKNLDDAAEAWIGWATVRGLAGRHRSAD